MTLDKPLIIDTHLHLWRQELAERSWLTAQMKPWYRAFEPSDFEQASASTGVRAGVLVEAGKTRQENDEMQRMAGSSSKIAAFMPHADLDDPGLGEQLDRWQQDPKFRGVRMGFENHADPDILKRPGVIEGLREIARRDLIFEILVRVPHLQDVVAIYETIPHLRGVVEHLAKPDLATDGERDEWQRGMAALAMHTSVHAKLSLSPRGEEVPDLLKGKKPGWPVAKLRPYVQVMIDHFGPGRLMWGSDWPIALATTDYPGIWATMQGLLSHLSPADLAKVNGGTANQFYRLDLE